MRRGKVSIRDVASEADDGWIWGNSRGGGGAPLKDREGKSLTNLKLVLAGDVEADHSPSKSPGQGDRHDYDDDDYAPRTSRRGDYDAYDDDRDFGGNRRRRRGGGGGGRQQRDDYDDYDDRDMAPRRGGGGRRQRNNHDNRHDDDYDSSRRPRQQRERDSIPGLDVGGSGSPKKHMSSLRAMNTSEDAEERQAKVKKELTYQEELKRQIDEKKRTKEIEEHKEASLKQKELEEYLSVHYKGNVPPHVAKKVRAQKMKLQEKEYELKIGEGGSSDRGGGRDADFGGPPKRETGGRSTPDRSRSIFDDEDESPTRRGAQGRKPRGGPRFDEEPDFDEEDLYGPPRGPRGGAAGGGSGRKSLKWADNDDADEEVIGGRGGGRRSVGMNRRRDDDVEADDPYGEPPMAPRGVKGSPQRGGGGGGEKWVPQAEYDELSALCDSLLKQQEDMQSELVTKKTQAGARGGRTGPAARGAVAGGARAKSQQQLHRERTKQPGPGTFGSSRPNSIQSTSRQPPSAPTSARGTRGGSARERGGQAKPAAPAKFAFGRSIVDNKGKKDKEEDGPMDSRQRKLVKAGGAAMGRVMMKANERGAGPRGSPNKPPMAPRRGGGGSEYGGSPQGPQGFHKLAAKARAGPVVVTYEDDLGGSDRSRGRTSVELSGESEYLRIGGEEVDLIR